METKDRDAEALDVAALALSTAQLAGRRAVFSGTLPTGAPNKVSFVNANIDANTTFFPTRNKSAGAEGNLSIVDVVNGVGNGSFGVQSSNAADASDVDCLVIG